MRGGQQQRVTMAGGGSSPKGQSVVAAASLPTPSACLQRSAMDRRQGGGRNGARGVLVKEEESGKKKGTGGICDAFYQCDRQQGKEMGGLGGGPVEERDGWREGVPSTAVSTGLWPWAGSLTHGPEATVMGSTV
jgi:hypothetical protein